MVQHYFVTDGMLVPGCMVLPWWDAPNILPVAALKPAADLALSPRLCWEDRETATFPSFWVQVLLELKSCIFLDFLLSLPKELLLTVSYLPPQSSYFLYRNFL